jgi:hypothetical protein
MERQKYGFSICHLSFVIEGVTDLSLWHAERTNRLSPDANDAINEK